MSSNLVIVAIPDENDVVWKVSSEKIPHLTLLFLGETDKAKNLDQIIQFVDHAVNRMLRRFYLHVDHRGVLGADRADVLFFRKGHFDYRTVHDFRSALLQDSNIKTAYDSATQFDGVWIPHLTLGYPAAPAKPDDSDHGLGFFDVAFNKVAVWTGDYEGVEFLLKDFAEEFEELGGVPMSNLQHHGVKGMKWGQRKAEVASGAKAVGRAAKATGGAVGKAAKATARFAGDVSFESKVEDGRAREQVIDAASKPFRKEDLPAIKARHGDYGKMLNRAKKPFSPEAKAYRKDARETYIKRLETEANKMKNPSGTRQYTIRERGLDLPAQGGNLPQSKYFWDVSARNVKHAAEDPFTRLEVIMEDGYITDLKPVEIENSMAQTAALGEAFLAHCGLRRADPFELAHHGVKGMKWGVRQDRGHEGEQVKTKKLAKLDKKFEKNVASSNTFFELHNRAAEGVNKEIGAFNKRFEDKYGKEKMDSGVLWNNNDPITKDYHQAYNEMFTKHLNEGAKAMGTNASGTRKVKIYTQNMDSFENFSWGYGTQPVKHADTLPDGDLRFIVTLDDQGRITKVEPLEEEMAQSSEDGEAFILEHFGVKGMRWGIRKQREVTTETHLDTGVFKRRTKVQATGGESHEAHPDAVKAAVQKQKLKKSGTDALSTEELKSLSNRLQLEAQVESLSTKKGKKFAQRQLEVQGQQTIQRGVQTGVTRGAKKVIKRGGKAAGVAALLA